MPSPHCSSSLGLRNLLKVGLILKLAKQQLPPNKKTKTKNFKELCVESKRDEILSADLVITKLYFLLLHLGERGKPQ